MTYPHPTEKPSYYGDIHWLSPEDYQKALTQFSMSLSVILFPLRTYGQQPFVDQAETEIVKLAEAFGLRVRGVNEPISLEVINKKRERVSLNERR